MNTVGGKIYKSMSDKDILNYLPNAQIISYSDLKKYKSISELLPKNNTFFILLYIDEKSQHTESGHWCLVMRYNSKIVYFDSFGHSPDEPLLKWLNCKERTKFNEGYLYLSKLLNNSNIPVFWSTYDYQNKTNEDVSTCGRWATARALKMLDSMDDEEFNKYILSLKKKYKLSYDALICHLIP